MILYKKPSPLNNKGIAISLSISLLIYAMFFLFSYAVPESPDSNDATRNTTKLWMTSQLLLPVVTLVYLIYLKTSQKVITNLHTNLHWMLLAFGVLTTFIMNLIVT